MEALKPATVRGVLLDYEHKKAIAVVQNNELSVAIGKMGVNARLAVRLTGWNIDIKELDEALRLGINYKTADQLIAEENAPEVDEVVEEEEVIEEPVQETKEEKVEEPVVEDKEESASTEESSNEEEKEEPKEEPAETKEEKVEEVVVEPEEKVVKIVTTINVLGKRLIKRLKIIRLLKKIQSFLQMLKQKKWIFILLKN